MVLSFGLFGGEPIYDSGGSMLVNQTSGSVANGIVWSTYANGKVVTASGIYLYMIDLNVTTAATLSNSSAGDDGWALQGDYGKVVTAKRLYTYYTSNMPAATGRWGRCNFLCSTDGTNWTTLKTGTLHQNVSAYAMEYDGADITFRYLRYEWNNEQNGGVNNVSLSAVEIFLILGGD